MIGHIFGLVPRLPTICRNSLVSKVDPLCWPSLVPRLPTIGQKESGIQIVIFHYADLASFPGLPSPNFTLPPIIAFIHRKRALCKLKSKNGGGPGLRLILTNQSTAVYVGVLCCNYTQCAKHTWFVCNSQLIRRSRRTQKSHNGEGLRMRLILTNRSTAMYAVYLQTLCVKCMWFVCNRLVPMSSLCSVTERELQISN